MPSLHCNTTDFDDEDFKIENFPVASSLEAFYVLLNNSPEQIEGYAEYGHHPAVAFDHIDKKIVNGGDNTVELSNKLLDEHGESYWTRYIVLKIRKSE